MKFNISLLIFAIAVLTASGANAACSVTYTEEGQPVAQLDKKYPRASMRNYTIKGVSYEPIKNAEGFKQEGEASWYGRPFHGRKTANGEKYNMFDFTAAHATLPIPSCVKVTNKRNGKSVVVRVNDRGPFKSDLGTDTSNRIIDLSLKAAVTLGFRKEGITDVEIEVLPTSHVY